jgi:hypothetical protein
MPFVHATTRRCVVSMLETSQVTWGENNIVFDLYLCRRNGLSSSGISASTLYYYFIIYLNCKWGFTRWQWYYNKAQHTSNTHHTEYHHTQTKHSTQNNTNNKGHYAQ